jgi:hypothetical protein
MKDSASSMAEDQDIDGKAWYNPGKYLDKAWKFCKDNAKWIAFGVAAAVAVGVTIATAGAGAPVGLAILAGAGAGLVGGTVIGGGLELASGRETNVLSAAWKVAPYAAAGGVGGALGGYFFAPAGLAALGGEAAVSSLGVASGSGFLATTGAGFATGTASGALWNAGKIRDGYEVGKYDNWKEAATDWGTGTLAWGVNGALAATPLKWGAQGVGGLRAAYAAGNLSKGVIAMEGAKIASAGMTMYGFPSTTEGLHTLGNVEAASISGYTPRWLGQSMGYSSAQIRAANEADAAKKNGGGQQQVETVQPQPEGAKPEEARRNADRNLQPEPVVEQPSTYQPGKVSYDDYTK